MDTDSSFDVYRRLSVFLGTVYLFGMSYREDDPERGEKYSGIRYTIGYNIPEGYSF